LQCFTEVGLIFCNGFVIVMQHNICMHSFGRYKQRARKQRSVQMSTMNGHQRSTFLYASDGTHA